MSKPTQEDIDLATAAEQKMDLPAGSLVGFIAEGGKLDGKARAKMLDTYGIDAKLNRRNAIEATGLALQDALSDNGNDATLAVAELYSGADRAKWNKATTTFATRALGSRGPDGSYMGNRPAPVAPAAAPSPTSQRSASGTAMTQPLGKRSASGMTDPRAPMQQPPSTDYGTGQSVEPMQAEPAAVAEAPIAAPVNTAAAGEPEGPVAAGPKTLAAYADGSMPADQRRKFEQYVADGGVTVPEGFKLGQTSAPTTLDRIVSAPGRALDAVGNAITGNDRRTAETDALPSWSQIPEWEDVGTIQNVSALFAAPREALQVLKSAAPGITIREDEKGNPIVYSPKAGREFAVQPGFDSGDAVRFGATLPIYAASAATGGLGAVMLREAAVQGGIELAQAASGGEFNPEQVALAAAVPAGLAGASIGGRRLANTLLDAVPGSTTRQVAGAAADAVAPVADDVAKAASSAPTRLESLAGAAGTALRKRLAPAADAARPPSGVVDDVTKVVPPRIGAVDDVTKVVPPPASAAANAAPPILETADIAEMLVNASKKGPKSDAAKQKLAELAAVDPKIAQAADDLGIALPVDMMSRNEQFKNLVGLARSKIGSEAQAELAGAVDGIVKRADELVKDFGAVVVEGSPSSAAVSGRVLSKMKGMQAELEAASGAAHDAISEVIPKATKVDVSGAQAEMNKIIKEVGRPSLSKAERQLEAVLFDPEGASYQAIKRQKDLVGKAIGGQESPYSNMAQGDLKRLYGLIAQAQEDAVRGVGGAGLVSKLQAANKLTVAQKGVEERILAGFGREGNGDLADKMTRAITAAKSEKSKPLDDLLEIVPEEMHREVIGTAVAKMVSGKDGVFSPEKFVDFYQGMRANPAASSRVFKVIGGDVEKVWRDLFEVSKAVANAKPKVKFTGIGNQDLESAIVGNGLIGKVIQSSVGRRAATAGAGALGFAAGGPAAGGGAGFLASSGLDALVSARASVLPTMGKLFSSPEFKAAAIAAGSGAVDTPAVKEAVRAVVASKPFRDWAGAAMLPREPKALEQWVMAAIQGARGPTTDAVNREAR